MGVIDDLIERGAKLGEYQSAALAASSTSVVSVAYRGFELHNPHASKTVSYSTDGGTTWFKVFSLGTKELRQDGNTLHLKGSAANSEYQLRVAEIV